MAVKVYMPIFKSSIKYDHFQKCRIRIAIPQSKYKYAAPYIVTEPNLEFLSCIFCDIIARRLPSIGIYEDENFMVLMDKYPLSRGHTLIIPKKHYDNLLVMPITEIGKLYSLVPIVAKAIILGVKAKGFNVGQNNGKAANQIIPHVHVHIVPRFGYDSPDDRWPIRQIVSHENLSEVADLIKPFLNLSMVDGG